MMKAVIDKSYAQRCHSMQSFEFGDFPTTDDREKMCREQIPALVLDIET